MLKRKQKLAELILGIFLFAGAMLPVTAFAQDYEDSPFAIHEPLIPMLDQVSDLTDIGVKWVRYFGKNGLVWDIIEPEKGKYDWAKHDKLYLDTYKAGIKMFVTTFAVNKAYGTEEGRLPTDMEAYKEFLKKAVERYNGDGIDDAPGSSVVDIWQIENEIDWSWKDTHENYALLLKESYEVIKQANPNAKVAISGVTSPPAFERFKPFIEKLNSLYPDSRYFEIFDIHWYPFNGTYNFYNVIIHPETVQFKIYINDINTCLSENGYSGTPIFITETAQYTGIPVAPNNLHNPFHGEKEQAEFLLKLYVYAISHGVDKLFWATLTEFHCFKGVPNHVFDHVGLIHNPLNNEHKSHKKLAYYTYKLMIEKLEGSDWDNIQTIRESDNLYIYKFTKQGKPIWVGWWDCFDDPTYTIGDSSLITLTGISSNQVIVTDAVPTDTSGIYITDYNTAFQIDTLNVSGGSVSFYLKESPVFIEEISNTSIEETGGVTPNEFQLNQNYPNPFNPETTISFQVETRHASSVHVELTVYDVQGREVRTLANENKSAGHHSVIWNGTDNSGQQLSSGIYFYSLKSDNNFSQMKKMLLLK